MQYVAAEMQDDHFRIRKIPADWRRDLLARAHRGEGAPHYEGPVVYVPDASRAASAWRKACCLTRPPSTSTNTDYDRFVCSTPTKADAHVAAGRRANHHPMDWSTTPASAQVHGRRLFKNRPDQFIDWGPFFQPGTWPGPSRF
jgi:5-methyltetrahydrofolate--homocysteine methyltransferase